jgi:hypothetical protein
MELKNGILHVRVNLKANRKTSNISVVDIPSEFTPSSSKSHKTTLSLSIPSESSPRLINLKKSLKPTKKRPKPSLINFALKPKIPKKLIHGLENKENQKKNSKEFSVKLEEIPSNLLKSSRKSILSSILQTSHKRLTLSSGLKLSLN